MEWTAETLGTNNAVRLLMIAVIIPGYDILRHPRLRPGISYFHQPQKIGEPPSPPIITDCTIKCLLKLSLPESVQIAVLVHCNRLRVAD